MVQRQAAEIARLRQAGAGPSAPAAVFAPRLRAAAAATADATGLGQALATGQRLLTGVPPTVVGGSNSRGVRTIFFVCTPVSLCTSCVFTGLKFDRFAATALQPGRSLRIFGLTPRGSQPAG